MTITHSSKGAEIRSRLDHPVIDADGHTIEITPVVLDFVKEVGGASTPSENGPGGSSP